MNEQTHNRHPVLMRSMMWAAVTIVLLAVFAMYLQPDFLVLLATQIWLCF